MAGADTLADKGTGQQLDVKDREQLLVAISKSG